MLFLDELGEFSPVVLDALRQPLEEGVVRVARAAVRLELPARFLLVGAMNPCPCGEGNPLGTCRCAPAARARYARRVSGPLLDRFDLRVEVARPDVGRLLGGTAEETSAAVAARVFHVRERTAERGVRVNGELHGAALDAAAPLTDAGTNVLESALRAGRLSGRGMDLPLPLTLPTGETVSAALVAYQGFLDIVGCWGGTFTSPRQSSGTRYSARQ